MQMGREDSSAMVQVGQHLLVINHLLPYAGWAEFSELIRKVLNEYLELVKSPSFRRVGLRYINRIPQHSREIGDYTTLTPPIPPGMGRSLVNFHQRYELLYENPEGVLIHQTGMQRTQDDDTALLLDLDFGSVTGSVPDMEEVVPWLDSAHIRIEESFRASINPDLLEKMRKGG